MITASDVATVRRIVISCTRSIKDRVLLMVGKSILKAVYDDKAIQLVKISVLNGEIQDEVERIQNFGMTSNPPPGGESVVLNLGGNKDHPVVIVLDHGKYRIKNLESGETVIYDKTGSTIWLKKDGKFEFTPSGEKSSFVGEIEATDVITGQKDIISNKDIKDAAGTLDQVRQDLAAFKLVYNSHTHICAQPGVASATPLPVAT